MANKRKKVSGVIKKEKSFKSFIVSYLGKNLLATLLAILSFVAFNFFNWKFGIIIFSISCCYLAITVLKEIYSRIENIFK